MELSSGVGFLSGPVFGSVLYTLMGYLGPFIVFAVLQAIATPLIYIFLKLHLKKLKLAHAIED